MKIEHAVEIPLSPEALWTYLTEPDEIRRWNADVVSIEADQPGPASVGSTSRVGIREGSKVVEYGEKLVVLDRPHRLVSELSGGSLGSAPMRLEYRLEPLPGPDGATKLSYRADWQPRELHLKLLSPLFAWMSRRNIRGQLERLAELVARPDAFGR